MSCGFTNFPGFRARRVSGGSSWIRMLIVGLWAFGLSAIGAVAATPGDGVTRLGSVAWEESLPAGDGEDLAAQPSEAEPGIARGRPLAELLNPDGTLNRELLGASGSIRGPVHGSLVVNRLSPHAHRLCAGRENRKPFFRSVYCWKRALAFAG